MNSIEISESSIGEASPFMESFKAEIFFSGVGRLTLLNNMRKDICDCIPVVVLTGAPGIGKSMVGRVLADGGFTGCHAIYLPKTVESFEDVVRVIAEKVDVAVDDYSRAGISSAMEKIAVGVRGYGQRLVLICDGAEKIYLATLERIRKMLDRVNATGVFMQVVFIGTPSLLANLKQLSICNFAEVPEKRYELKPLTLSETTTYIEGCLKRLSSEDREVFTPEVIDRIFQNSSGNFKRINALAEEVRKRHSNDASFWVLLENVEGGKPPSGRFKQLMWSKIPSLQNRKSTKVLIAGSMLALGAVFLLLTTGRHEAEIPLEGSQSAEISEQRIIESTAADGTDEIVVQHEEGGKIEDSQPEEITTVVDEKNHVDEITVSDATEITDNLNGEIVSTATSLLPEEPKDEEVPVEVPQIINKQAGNIAEETTSEEIHQNVTYQAVDNTAEVAIVPQVESVEADIQAVKETDIEALPEKSVESMPVETVTNVLDIQDEQSLSPIEVAPQGVVEDVTPEPVAIPVISATVMKKIILIPTEKKEIDEKSEKSNIVISSLTNTNELEVPVIVGGAEKKRIVAQAVEQTAPALRVLKQNPVKIETSAAVSNPSTLQTVQPKPGLPGLPVQSEEEVDRERGPAETDIKKIPVVGAAIIPEVSSVVHGDMYAKRVAAGRSWLSGKKDKKYTIQLMVLSSDAAEESMGKILTQEQYSKEVGQFYIFEKATNPQAVFVFLGEYNTMTEAREARNSIPDAFQKHKPYVLSVQGAMQKVK
jgi:type II secretory pathway predicted ATPase ExeA/septal ring-binding cell division protein DamX